jgi:hypothetical protein
MADPVDSVNKLIASFKRTLERVDLSDQTRGHYKTVYDALCSAKVYIGELEKSLLVLEAKLKPLPSRLGDLSDLPPELLAELSAPRGDELENQITVVLQAYGGTADLDQVLVGLFRKFKVSQKRRFLQNKVWRMCQKDMLWSIRGKKGVYTLNEPADDEKDEIPSAQTVEDELEI